MSETKAARAVRRAAAAANLRAITPDQSPAERAQIIDACQTGPGGWTRDVLAHWGVPWPPPKGWRHQLVKCGVLG